MFDSQHSSITKSHEGLLSNYSSSQSVFSLARARKPSLRFLIRLSVALAAFALVAIFFSHGEVLPNLSMISLNVGDNERSVELPLEEGLKRMKAHEEKALHNYAASKLHRILPAKDFLEFAYRLRFYGDLFDGYEAENKFIFDKSVLEKWFEERNQLLEANAPKEEITAEREKMFTPYPTSPTLRKLEKDLFPWAYDKYPSLFDMKQSFKGKGIVIPTGSHHLRFAVHLARHIRLLKCKLPIMIAFCGENDLKQEERDFLQRMNLELLDVSKIIDTTNLGLGGWEIKPFALMAAPFEEVILADADIVFMQSPDVLFEDELYKEHGAVIFHDRTLFAGDKGKTHWLDQNLPSPLSKRIKESRMYQRKSAHEQESGVVVWNKKTRFLGLLAACKMNSKLERDLVTYKTFYGDKESFWIGLEMAAQSWTEFQPVPGVIGDSHWDNGKDQLVACGRILQFDREGWPLWFNGAIVKNKRDEEESKILMNITHYAREGIWDFGNSCLDHDVTPLNATQKTIIDEIGAIWVPNIDYSGSAEGFKI